MAIDIKDAFQATPKSVRSFLIEPGQGCYIPAYQREYRWDKSNVDRLFEDISNGISQLVDRANTISFLGTVIAIHDTSYATVKPINRSEMPRSVMTIIDGQQRLSTFILIFIALHNHLSRLLNQLEKQESEADKWLKTEIRKLLPELQDCFVLDRRTGSGLYQFYPRLIRSFVDIWSSQPDSAQYDGAIAGIIWQYIEHINGADKNKDFRPKAHGEDGAFINVQKVYAHIANRIKKLRRPSEDFADLLTCAVEKDFGLELLGYDFDPQVVDRLATDDDTTEAKRFRDAVANLVFAHYAQQRMAFTVVESRNEDDAFDMFEALNTTGEPLTAFETFEPRIIEAEGLDKYEESIAYEQVSRVKSYLDQFIKDTSQVQKSTSDLLVSFALADTGRKLGGKLNEQRRYLRRRFDEPGSPVSRAAFIHRLGDVADFMSKVWDLGSENALAPMGFLDEQTMVCLDYLRRMKHTITVAPISRFYGKALLAIANDGASKHAERQLQGSIKACAAFTAIWRGAFGSTSNIDAVYRAAMAEGDGVRALAAEPKDRTAAVDLDLLKTILRAALAKEKLDTAANWASRVKSTPLYKQSRPTVIFITAAGSKDAVPDDLNPGLAKLGRSNVNDTLSINAWKQFVSMEVEHVAPQSGSGGTWDQLIYDEADLVHALGNLTLLRKEQNIVMSDHSWDKKRLGFKALSAQTHEAFNNVRADALKSGLDLPAGGEAVLASSAYAPLLVPISNMLTEWNSDFIQRRSTRLAEMAWNQLNAWLK